MKWFFQMILELLAMIVAYATNWLVVFFCDEHGWLPKCLKWWQTYDNCLDVEWMITEGIVPKCFRYNYKKHYVYHYEYKDGEVMIPGYVELINADFTFKERAQRYFCRVLWLYRNSNYGFSYYVNGRDVDGAKNIVKKDIKEPNNEQWISYIPNCLWNITWSVFYCKQYCRWFRLRIYIGWKLKGIRNGKQRCMLAISVNPFKGLEKR